MTSRKTAGKETRLHVVTATEANTHGILLNVGFNIFTLRWVKPNCTALPVPSD